MAVLLDNFLSASSAMEKEERSQEQGQAREREEGGREGGREGVARSSSPVPSIGVYEPPHARSNI